MSLKVLTTSSKDEYNSPVFLDKESVLDDREINMEVLEEEEQVGPLLDSNETVAAAQPMKIKHSLQDASQAMSPGVSNCTSEFSTLVAFFSAPNENSMLSNTPQSISDPNFPTKGSNKDFFSCSTDSLSLAKQPETFTLQQEEKGNNGVFPQEEGLTPPSQEKEEIKKNTPAAVSAKNLVISEGFLATNTVANRPMLHPAKTLTKTFAQIAAPPTVADSIPSGGSSPECGILVERMKGSLLDDYARAIEVVTGKRTLVFIGQSPEDPQFVMAFLGQPTLVNKVVSVGIHVKGRWLCVTHLRQPASKLIISDVLPYIPDSDIIAACNGFGKPVFQNLRRIPSSVRAHEYKHLLSFRRELLIVLDKKKVIPDILAFYSDGILYKLPVTTPGLVCFNCKVHGHKSVNCKRPKVVKVNQELVDHPDAVKPVEILDGFGGIETKSTQPTPGLSSSVPAANKNIVSLKDVKKMSGSDPDSGHKSTQLQTCVPPSNSTTSLTTQVMHHHNSPIEKEAWLVVGKKGKAFPLSGNAVNAFPAAKALKTGNFSDIAISRRHNVTRRVSHSPDGSVPDTEMALPSDDFNISKRKKRQPKKTSLDPDQLVQASSPKLESGKETNTNVNSQNTNTNKDSVPAMRPSSKGHVTLGGAVQLKEILAGQRKLHGFKSKVHRKEVSTAQPIIEDLLSTVWSRRTSRRRAILADFEDRHEHLHKHLEVVMAAIPLDMHSTQVYRSLVSIKQDLKLLQSSDGRKSRVNESQSCNTST